MSTAIKRLSPGLTEVLLNVRQCFRRWYPYDEHKIANAAKVFIVSTGRTGTKFLAHFLNTCSMNARAFHEPYPAHIDLGLDHAYGWCSIDRAARVLSLDRRFYLHHLDRPIYVESNNRFFSLLCALETAFPGAKFVHVVRDGREVVCSGLPRGWYAPRDWARRLRAPDFPDDPWRHAWASWSAFEKCCWLWQKQNAIMRQQVAQLASARTHRFEDIFGRANGWSHMKQLLDFIGADVELESDMLSRVMKKKINAGSSSMDWHDWSENQMAAFWAIAGEEMLRYGYE